MNQPGDGLEELAFEALFQRLESIVEELGADSASMEQALHSYEQGINIAKECLGRLDRAEQKVLILKRQLEPGVVSKPDNPEEHGQKDPYPFEPHNEMDLPF